jgi:nitrogen regulatory protein PII
MTNLSMSQPDPVEFRIQPKMTLGALGAFLLYGAIAACFYRFLGIRIFGGWVLACLIHVSVATLHRAHKVKMITCLIRPEQLEDVAQALKAQNLMIGMTVMDVRGFGRQKGDASASHAYAKEKDEIKFLPKLKLEILIREWDVDRAVDVMANTLRTGHIGDGKIIVYNASSAMRVRTGERGIHAL